MNNLNWLDRLKNITVVILSALAATFLFSVSSIFFSLDKYEKIIWLIDTSLYSFFISLIWDLIVIQVNRKRMRVDFSFSNERQENNALILKKDTDYKTIKLSITIKGYFYTTKSKFKLIEPEGLTIQINNRYSFINFLEKESVYEIDINKLISDKLPKSKKKKDYSDIKRGVEFQVILDNYEDDYEDSIYVHHEQISWKDKIKMIVKQKKIIIKKN